MKLKSPKEIQELINTGDLIDVHALFEYIDKLHNQLMEYQLIFNAVKSKDKDIHF